MGLLAIGVYAQDEDLGYPPGSLTPNIDLGLQEVSATVSPTSTSSFSTTCA